MLPRGLTRLAQLRLAAAAGFEGVEMSSTSRAEDADEIHHAASAAGITIHSVESGDSWRYPLSSPDRDDVVRGVEAVRIAIDNARRWGADTVLVIAGRVDARTSCEQAYARSQEVIRRELLPYAAASQVVLAIENVWSGFLLSPIEYVRFIDEFESPWVRAYIDVGNVIFGHPEHWIRSAGHRIVKLHVKDFSLNMRTGRFAWSAIGDGAIDWTAVSAALVDVGFSGWATNTGLPRSFLPLWIERGALVMQRLGVHDWPVLGDTTRFALRQTGRRRLRRLAGRFDRLSRGLSAR
jgi:L-ribulose-5-phosphate 3-epimerase